MDLAVIFAAVASFAVSVGGKLVFALLVWLVGNWLIKKVVALLDASKGMEKVEGTVRTFVMSFVKIGLYVVLGISIIAILGVPMSSVIAVLASAGVTVGLALQGALSNLAGGIMLAVFRPFKQGDYIDAAGESGTVREVSLLYTVLITPDNKRITIPNGALMNANIVDYSSEEFRRVDLTFACAKTEDPARVQQLILAELGKHELVLSAPDAPFARLSGGTNEAMQFAARVWCKNEDYWTLYFDLTQAVTQALGAAGVQAPAVRVVSEK